MNSLKITVAAIALAMTAGMVSAGDITAIGAGGVAGGGSAVEVYGSGMSATGGLAMGNNNGTSIVRNESAAGQLSLSRSSLEFTATNTVTDTVTNDVTATGGNNGHRGGHGNTNTTTSTDYAGTTVTTTGLQVVQLNEAYTDGFDTSKTVVADRGTGTAGLGASVAVREGSAQSAGGYVLLGGTASWN